MTPYIPGRDEQISSRKDAKAQGAEIPSADQCVTLEIKTGEQVLLAVRPDGSITFNPSPEFNQAILNTFERALAYFGKTSAIQDGGDDAPPSNGGKA